MSLLCLNDKPHAFEPKQF